MSSLRVLSTNETNLVKLCIWCRTLQLEGKYPASIRDRFSIAFYQVGQGIEWGDNVNGWESMAAATVHLITLAEQLDIDLYVDTNGYLPINLYSLPRQQKLYHKDLLIGLSRLQKMVFYRTSATNRRKRYNKKETTRIIANCIIFFIGTIPRSKRKEAIENATEIMTGTL